MKAIILIRKHVLAVMFTALAFDASSQLSFAPYYGASNPLGDYKEKPISRATNGYNYGLSAGYTFMESNLGIGLDLRYSRHGHTAPDTVYFRQVTHTIVSANTANAYSSAQRFGLLGIFLGPSYRIGDGRLGLELYAKGGIVFEKFPSYVLREKKTTDYVVGGPTTVETRDLSKVRSDRGTSFAGLFGAKIDLEIMPNVGLFLYGDYQSQIGKEGNFIVEDLVGNAPAQSVSMKMLSFGGGIRISLGSGREYGTIRDNY